MPAFAVPAAWRAYGAGYLDKDQVTERVMAVVKNFNKVDPAKVSAAHAPLILLYLSQIDETWLLLNLLVARATARGLARGEGPTPRMEETFDRLIASR